MRWIIINCLLLALAYSETRPKRDLNYLTNLFTTLFRSKLTSSPRPLNIDPEYTLFRVPSLGNKLFKVVTKENHQVELNEKHNETPQGIKIGTLSGIADTRERVYVIPNERDNYDTEYKVKIPFEPKYSYKQMQNNEPVMTYTAHNNPDVSVNTVIKVRKALPKCIKHRIDQVVLMGANPYTVEPSSTKFPIRPHPSINIKYPGDEETHVQDPIKLSRRNMILRPKLTEMISAKQIPLFTGDQSDVPTDPIVHPVLNMDQTVGDRIIGLIPPPYIPHATTEKKEDNTQDTREKINEVNLTKTPLTDQTFPSYVYKQLNHHSSNPVTIVQVGDQLDTNHDKNINSNPPSLSNYVFIPPKVNELSTQDHNTVSAVGKLNDSVNSFENNPIVVSDSKTFSYHQKNIDGSSISINGDNKGVFIDVKNSAVANNRGDIPDPLM